MVSEENKVVKREGKFVVEDVKGVKTPEYKIKAKLMFRNYHIRIRET